MDSININDKYFKFIEEKGKNFLMQCQICLSSRVVISAAKNSTSKIKRHIKVCIDVPNTAYVAMLDMLIGICFRNVLYIIL